MSGDGFPKLPKGYTWRIKYEVRYGNHAIRVSIKRFGGTWTTAYKWFTFQEDEVPYKNYVPTPDQVHSAGVRCAESCWKIFTKTSLGDRRLDAVKALENSLNSGKL